MSTVQTLIAELETEAATTRTVLAAVPEAKFGWRPHAKSFTAGELATHIANIPTWVGATLELAELDLAPPGGAGFTPPKAASIREVLAQLDANVAAARARLARASAADLEQPWTLKKGGLAKFTLPKGAVLRSFVLNHLVHHRGQMTVYLRLCDAPVPAVYGPTADVKF